MPIEVHRGGRGDLDEVRRTTRFLLDNDTDLVTLLRYFDGIGVSADELPPEIRDRTDDEVLAYAWGVDRVLLTHDEDFLDETRHPWETNPGVVVMPGGSGDIGRFLPVIGNMLRTIIKPYRNLWLYTYTHIQASGDIVVKGVDATHKTRIEPWRMRFDDDGNPLQWVAE